MSESNFFASSGKQFNANSHPSLSLLPETCRPSVVVADAVVTASAASAGSAARLGDGGDGTCIPPRQTRACNRPVCPSTMCH